MRSFTAAQQAALYAAATLMTWLLQLDFASGTVYLNTGAVTIAHDGHDWLAGQAIGIDLIKETDTGEATGFRLSLATTSEALIARALTERTTSRACYVRLALFDSATGAVIDTPGEIEQGLCDQPTISEDGSSAMVALAIETEIADYARPRVFRYTNADQQQRHSGDRIFEYVGQMAERSFAFPSVEFQRG